jgi:hypothetical protein
VDEGLLDVDGNYGSVGAELELEEEEEALLYLED